MVGRDPLEQAAESPELPRGEAVAEKSRVSYAQLTNAGEAQLHEAAPRASG